MPSNTGMRKLAEGNLTDEELLGLIKEALVELGECRVGHVKDWIWKRTGCHVHVNRLVKFIEKIPNVKRRWISLPQVDRHYKYTFVQPLSFHLEDER